MNCNVIIEYCVRVSITSSEQNTSLRRHLSAVKKNVDDFHLRGGREGRRGGEGGRRGGEGEGGRGGEEQGEGGEGGEGQGEGRRVQVNRHEPASSLLSLTPL